MAQFAVGAHTFFFSQYGMAPATQIDEMFAAVAQAGFDAVEIYAPQLQAADWRDRILDALERHSLRLVGVSNGQPYWNIEQHDAIVSSMADFLDKLTALDLGPLQCGCSCSGKRLADRTPDENEQCVRTWTEVAAMFRDRGHILNYHTHGEPAADIDLIANGVPADLLPLGPDLDWLRVGGVDPVDFVQRHADRLVMLHIRDYHLGGDRTEALGEGDADYRKLGEVLDAIGFTGEFVVELAIPAGKQPTRDPLELLTVSRRHIRDTIGV